MATSDMFVGYARNIRSSSVGVPALALRLRSTAPEDLRADERAALAQVMACARAVDEAEADRVRLALPKLRPRLTAFITAWTALYDALGAMARLPTHVSPRSGRAQQLAINLFPEGIAWVYLRADVAWGEGERRLHRIADEDLHAALTDVIDPAFFDAAKLASRRLAESLGVVVGAPRPPSKRALVDALAAFGHAVGSYARLLAAHCDPSDADSVARFRAAVTPIDEHRARRRAKQSASSDTTAQVAPSAASGAATTV